MKPIPASKFLGTYKCQKCGKRRCKHWNIGDGFIEARCHNCRNTWHLKEKYYEKFIETRSY